MTKVGIINFGGGEVVGSPTPLEAIILLSNQLSV